MVTFHPDISRCHQALEAVAEQVGRVVVVDNASPPKTAAALRQICNSLGVVLLELEDNTGIGRAQNLGIAHLLDHPDSDGGQVSEGGEVIDQLLLLDDDSVLESGAVARLSATLARFHNAQPPVGAVGPLVGDRRTGSAESPDTLAYVNRRLGPRRAQQGDRLTNPPHICAAFLLASGCLISKDAWQRVGPMNAAWFIDHIDLEWGLRARECGYELWVIPSVRLDHHLGDRVVKLRGRSQQIHVHSPTRNYYLARNTVLLLQSGLLPWGWRLGYVIWLAKYVVFNSLWVSPRRTRLFRIGQGIWHGLRGVSGPMR